MLDLLAVQATNATEIIVLALGALLTGGVGGSIIERKRNGRRNNPGNPDDYRYIGKRGSNCKPGQGETCKKHGEDISAAQATIQALGASQAAIHQSQTETRKEIGELRRETAASFRGLHARLDAALSR